MAVLILLKKILQAVIIIIIINFIKWFFLPCRANSKFQQTLESSECLKKKRILTQMYYFYVAKNLSWYEFVNIVYVMSWVIEDSMCEGQEVHLFWFKIPKLSLKIHKKKKKSRVWFPNAANRWADGRWMNFLNALKPSVFLFFFFKILIIKKKKQERKNKLTYTCTHTHAHTHNSRED